MCCAAEGEDIWGHVIGAKLVLLLGDNLVSLQRDDVPTIPWPGCWDLPGGGREAGESPRACVLRETAEEVGLLLQESDLVWERCYESPTVAGQFGVWFAARLPAHVAADLVLGDEGQALVVEPPARWLRRPDIVPHFGPRVREALRALGVDFLANE